MNKPRNVIVVLLDSLNRHMLGCYGGKEFATPNIDRFASQCVQFENHFVGSLPCMPARHDILCGALDFLWKPWGSIELWEEAITAPLRRAGVTTMLVTDHPHLFETGGENYHHDFSAWQYLRGHENDPWKTRADPSFIGAPVLPATTGHGQRYNTSRTYFREELDFPGPKTMNAATNWINANADSHDRFFLFVDEFDPHEPFDTPLPWANRYDPDWHDDLMIWPPYSVKTLEKGILNAREARHIRANYGSKLSMIDHWFGKLIDSVTAKDLLEDTAVILCTDHGHYLGEKDIFGKPGVPHYQPMGHTPLMIYAPGIAPHKVSALTTNVDIHATLLDLFATSSQHRTHGKSLVGLFDKTTTSVREWALAGVYGRWVHIHDGRHIYARSPVNAGNLPLSMWSNRWSTMPIMQMPDLQLPLPNQQAELRTMPGSDIPVIYQAFQEGDLLPFWSYRQPINEHHLYDLENDPEETENRLGGSDETQMQELLTEALRSVSAPDDQFGRLGLTVP